MNWGTDKLLKISYEMALSRKRIETRIKKTKMNEPPMTPAEQHNRETDDEIEVIEE